MKNIIFLILLGFSCSGQTFDTTNNYKIINHSNCQCVPIQNVFWTNVDTIPAQYMCILGTDFQQSQYVNWYVFLTDSLFNKIDKSSYNIPMNINNGGLQGYGQALNVNDIYWPFQFFSGYMKVTLK